LKWVELSLSVDGELAEAVAEVLARYAPGGVAAEQAAVDERTARPAPKITVRAYLPVDDQLEHMKESIERALWHLGQIQSLPPLQYRELEATDWEDAWRAHYHPIPIGRSLLILPPWVEPDPGDRMPLVIEPGMAFGTGTHPTTQLCLNLLEGRISPETKVVDLGCGSGILSVAAVLLGAPQVLAVDIDQTAIEITLSNAERNGVDAQIHAAQGSLEQLPGLLEQGGGEPPDLLVANILASVLNKMLDDGLATIVKPAGWLILSGILDEQLPELLDRARGHGLVARQTLADGDWRAVELQRTVE